MARELLSPARSVSAFARKPFGTYLTGSCWLVFSSSASLFSGLTLWGEPNEACISNVAPILLNHASYPPHPSLVDTRHLLRVDPIAFGFLAEFVAKHGSALAATVSQVAVLHGTGLTGAVAAGFASASPLPFPVRVFDDAGEALEWLGRTAEAPLFAEVDRIVADVRDKAPLLGRLAALLEASAGTALNDAARALGTSPRTLQRELREHGTTFQRERDAARVKTAKRLLAESGADVFRVALAVGVGSSQALAAIFRRIVGQTPEQWRRTQADARERHSGDG
jgi:AraC-like DNA-binding protein